MTHYFSWIRLWAVILKEFIQMKRDRLTFGMIIGIPLMQLILFGYAINFDPKNLPTAVVSANDSAFTRDMILALKNSSYFEILPDIKTAHEVDQLLARGEIQFAIYFPQNFTQRLIRNEKPEILIEADATDPSSTSFAFNVVANLNQVLNKSLVGSLQYLHQNDPPVNFVVQPKYNPERITQFNIVPGLLGVVLSMTMVMITSLAIARERERGTMESLLAMPVRPIEVMLGKIIPYVLVGYIQITLILVAAFTLFSVPVNGSVLLLYLCSLLFIAANLTVGLFFSTLVKTQLQAMQLAFFFFLPSIMLSGFMFPFRGMPDWAQYIGDCLPLTHFLPIVRGILLKGNTIMDIVPHLGAILLFLLIVLGIGVKRYRQTLD